MLLEIKLLQHVFQPKQLISGIAMLNTLTQTLILIDGFFLTFPRQLVASNTKCPVVNPSLDGYPVNLH